MKVTKDIPKSILKNENDFQGEFYQRFNLRHAAKPVALTKTAKKELSVSDILWECDLRHWNISLFL